MTPPRGRTTRVLRAMQHSTSEHDRILQPDEIEKHAPTSFGWNPSDLSSRTNVEQEYDHANGQNEHEESINQDETKSFRWAEYDRITGDLR